MTKALQNHAWIKDPFTYNKAFKKKIKKKNLEEITKKFNVTDFNVTLISPTKGEPKPIKLKINTQKNNSRRSPNLLLRALTDDL